MNKIYLFINSWVKPRMTNEIRNGRSRMRNNPNSKDSFKMRIYRKIYHLNYVIFGDKNV